MKRSFLLLSGLAIMVFSNTLLAQDICGEIADRCEQHVTASYIPDGQFYRALLNEDEKAEFELTLYGGTTYRVAACTGATDGALIFSVYDKERNLLFTNEDHDNDPYWDLAVTNTLDVTIEGHLDNSKVGSGCAVLLIGFKR